MPAIIGSWRRCGLLLTGLLLCSPALAKGKPVIERTLDPHGKVSDTTAPGRPLGLQGRHLHTCAAKDCRHPDVVVKIAGKTAYVQIAKDDLVQVMVPPETKLGTARVTLEVRGRGKAKAQVKVVKTIEDAPDGQGQPDPADAIRAGFGITSFVFTQTAKGGVFKIAGKAKAPDGFVVRLRLGFDQRTRQVAERIVAVKGGAFATEFGPFKQQVNLGNWVAELVFTLGAQSRSKRRPWLETLKRAEKQALKRIVRRGHVAVGVGADGKIPAASIAAAREQVVAHATPLRTELEALVAEARATYALAARCFFKAPGTSTYDADGYRAWLVKNGHAADAKAAEALSKDTRFGTRRGHFDAKAYATWGEGALTKLGALQARQATFDARTLVPVDERVSRGVARALSIALRLQQTWSAALHQRSKVSLPASLKREPFRPSGGGQASLKGFQAASRTLDALIEAGN